MADVSDRRCAVCKMAMSHTRGAHSVTTQEAAFYCSGKCRRRARRGQEAAGAVARIRLDDEAALYPPSGGPLDWLQLPRNVVKEVQGRLELPDLLQMAQACKAWLSCMAEGMTEVEMEGGSQDLHTLSNTVYLLDRLLPAVTSLSFTLPILGDTSERIQVLSRATRLQHLELTVEGSLRAAGGIPTHEQLMWLPALARLTRLRSLAFAAPCDTSMDLCHLAPLTALTRLSLDCSSTWTSLWPEHATDDAVDVLAALPLEHLEVPDQLLATCELSRLTRLTHLTITDLDVSLDNHVAAAGADMAAYMAQYCGALAALPRLQALFVGTPDSSDRPKSIIARGVWTADLLEAASHHLAKVPELRLLVGAFSYLPAAPSSMGHLARLTNLTGLRLVLASWDDSMTTGLGLAALGALSRLQRLSLEVAMYNEAATLAAEPEEGSEENAVVVCEHQLRAVCLQLQRLTQLRLGLRPCWLWPGPTALRHLSKLRSLRDLSLRLPHDNILPLETFGRVRLLKEYFPPSLVEKELAGCYHLS